MLPVACCLYSRTRTALHACYHNRSPRRDDARVYACSPLAVPWEHALTGCQLVQLALWFFAGSAKVGPWMKYVMCFMLPNSLLMRVTDAVGLLRFKSLFVDHPRGAHASACLTQPHVLLCLC